MSRLLKNTRHFGKYLGKMYRFAGRYPTKGLAVAEADRHRAKGKLVRITYRKPILAYELWVR